MGIWEMSAAQVIRSGGPIMIPIILCSIIALSVSIGKLLYFSSITTNSHAFKSEIFKLLRENNFKEAVELCNKSRSPVAKILKAGILRFGTSKDEIREAIENVSVFEIPKLEDRMTALSTIAHITPLLGLLGTVTGMIGGFYTIQARAASLSPVTPGDLAGNISEALLTTVGGLMVAIPTYVIYNYLVNRINTFVLEMERAGSELINFSSNLVESNKLTI